jgi:putative DNA-invertase from lambdoid prophage Rac
MGQNRALSRSKSGRVFGHPSEQTKTKLRVGLYARVSTHDQQTIPLQIRALREYTARRGWAVAVQIKEVGSGASRRERREKLLEAARRREIDVVLVWRLDRWGRSVTDLLATLQELEHLGVGFVSMTEALDLTTPAGRAMAGLLAVFAEFEREILRERVRAGLAQARQNGQRLGRPLTAALHTDQVRKLYRTGSSKAEIARRLLIGRTSVRRILASKQLQIRFAQTILRTLPERTREKRSQRAHDA